MIQRHYFVHKYSSCLGYGFSSGHVWMWELDYKESWALKNWCFWTVVLEKTLESPLDSKEIQPVHSEGNQSWIFIGRTDAEAETPIIWPPDAKIWLIWKDPDAGKDWRREEKGTKEDEMVGWHHRLNGHEFEKVPGVDDGQGSLACCNPQSSIELDRTERLNWTKTKIPASIKLTFWEKQTLKQKCKGLPWWLSGKESASHCRRHGCKPWSRKIPHAATTETQGPRACAPQEELQRWEARVPRGRVTLLTAPRGNLHTATKAQHHQR